MNMIELKLMLNPHQEPKKALAYWFGTQSIIFQWLHLKNNNTLSLFLVILPQHILLAYK